MTDEVFDQPVRIFGVPQEDQLHRRLNILVFMNPEWQDDWGGFFELWDPEVKHCLHSLAPLGNRCVVFNSDLFHRTDDIHFRDGYEDRRINITMLYGTREADHAARRG